MLTRLFCSINIFSTCKFSLQFLLKHICYFYRKSYVVTVNCATITILFINGLVSSEQLSFNNYESFSNCCKTEGHEVSITK